jgi:hypothetical protein
VSQGSRRNLRPLLDRFGVCTSSGRVMKPNGAGGRRLVNHALEQMEQDIPLHVLGQGYPLSWSIPTTSHDEAIGDVFAGWAAPRVGSTTPVRCSDSPAIASSSRSHQSLARPGGVEPRAGLRGPVRLYLLTHASTPAVRGDQR